MHEQADLLNNIGNVGPSKSEILEGASQATIVGGDGEKFAILRGGLGAGVDGSGDRLTIKHLGTLENLKCVLMLAKKEAGGVGGDVDAQKMVKGAEISHRELGLERVNDRVEGGGGARRDNDVIHYTNT